MIKKGRNRRNKRAIIILLRQLFAKQVHPTREAGFSLPLVIAAALMLIVGGLALANRANQGLLGSIFQSQSWEAREAAEIGMNRIVSELNQERNRWLMVQRDGDADSGIWQNRETSSTIVQLRINPCSPTVYPRYNKLDPDNAAAKPYPKSWYIDANGNVSSSSAGATRAYRLVGVTRQTFANSSGAQTLSPFRDRSASPSGVGRIILEVQGQALRNGTAVASVTLEKELELVPKCCKVSFGGEHGGVDYTIDPTSSSSACVRPEQLGLGLLAGAAQNNTGAITLRGAATDIETATGTPVDPIYCIADTSAGCAIRVSGTDVNVAIIDHELPPAKTFPGSASPAALATNNADFNSTSSGDFLYSVGIRGSRGATTTYKIINGGFTRAASLPSYCVVSGDSNLGDATITGDVHCNLTSFDYRGDNLIFLTGRRRIFFYFPNPGTVISQTGNGNMLHCLTLNTSTGGCNTTPSGAEITRLSMFGCNRSSSCTSQSVSFKGTVDGLKLFTYFPVGNVTLVGDSSFEGINWSNVITSMGNPTWVVPGSGLASVFELMDMLPGSSGGGSATNSLIAYDFVARATNRYRWK